MQTHETATEYGYSIDVCVDCLFVLANGIEDEDGERAAAGMVRNWPDADLTINCDEDCEGHFSWSDCQGCGSALGGDRHPVVAWLPKS